MVKKYATPKRIPFLESIPRVHTSRFLDVDHYYGTFTKIHGKKKVNLYRINSMCVMLCVCGERKSKRDLLSHFQKRKECLVY
jgi:hypothetical protein